MVATNSNNGLITNTPVKHAPASILPNWMLKERTKYLTSPELPLPSLFLSSKNNKTKAVGSASKNDGGSVVYWMHRDMRTVDNWALLWAAYIAQQYELDLKVVYTLQPPPSSPPNLRNDTSSSYPLPPTLIDMPMTARHGHFLLGGLELVHQELKNYDIPFHVLTPSSHDEVGQTFCDFVFSSECKFVICDFSPLRHARQWMELQAAPILERQLSNEKNDPIPMFQVDCHNIVPVWIAGEGKRQIGARTLRPRIHKVIEKYLQDFPSLDQIYDYKNKNKNVSAKLPSFDRTGYESFLQMDENVPPVSDWAIPGTKAGMEQYEFFVQNGLRVYHDKRNDPTIKNICSNLSPWTNHGHISFQRITMKVKQLNKHADGTSSFVEEGVVRRELSDNFVYYTPNDYDALTAALGWAQETLAAHAQDKRQWVYTLSQLEEGKTHDDLWNAAQLQLVHEGQMHGFMRMYWAKKILEWTISPNFALRAAQYFNDKYALDGKDPNGFVGVGWSIMGIHDQGWKERDIFGKIRYMNYDGCKRKFNVAAFVAMYSDKMKGGSRQSTLQLSSGQSKGKSTTGNTKSSIKTSGTSKKRGSTQSTIPCTLRKKLK